MKALLLVSILFLLIFTISGVPGLLADDDDDPGGSAFDEPGTEEEAVPDEPKPAKFVFKDYKIFMETKDGRWWKHHKKLSEKDLKNFFVLRLHFKLPKSESRWDVQLDVRGLKKGVSMNFDDGTSVKVTEYKTLCTKSFEQELKKFEGVKDIEKPKKVALGKKRWKAYRFAMTGQPSWYRGMALRKVAYYWKLDETTYFMSVLFSTTAAKNKRIVKEVDDLLKSLQEKQERR